MLLRKLMDPSDKENSSKRFITLIIAFHFILASFFILFLFGFLIFRDAKGSLELVKLVSANLEGILEYDFYIIISGLGFITAEGFTTVLVERAKAKGFFANNTTDVLKDPELPVEEIKP